MGWLAIPFFNITVSDPSVAEITGITTPSWHNGLWIRQVISTADNSIAEVDIDQTNIPHNPDGMIVPGITNVKLATVNLKAINGGTATITISNPQIDSDRPNSNQGIIAATIVPGSISVPVSTGSIKIMSKPSGAEIYINNGDSGFTTPHTFENIPRENTVVVKLKCYNDPTVRIITVPVGAEVPADFSLSSDGTCNNIPEFSSIFLPATMIIGFLSVVLLIQNKRTLTFFNHIIAFYCPKMGAGTFEHGNIRSSREILFDGSDKGYIAIVGPCPS